MPPRGDLPRARKAASCVHVNTSRAPSPPPLHGRGTYLNPANRFESLHLAGCPDFDDPSCPPEERPHPRTQFFTDASESLLTKNDSPDVGFAWGLNCYRGCEHGCAYCFARPFHEYLGWSSGLDFETKILVKLRAPELLRRELAAPRWTGEPIGMSGVTDCYQPAERHFQLTRACLAVCAEARQPVALITKNALVTRDLDHLRELARHDGVLVNLSVTTLDADLASVLEPRASRPAARLDAIRQLSAAGIPVNVLVAPVIPGLNDHEVPAILGAVAAAGARSATYVLLRLPHAVKDIFTQWLDDHAPLKKARILDRLRALRGGKLYDSRWGERMRGHGLFAEQLEQLFTVAARRAGLARRPAPLSSAHFRRPSGGQLQLF